MSEKWSVTVWTTTFVVVYVALDWVSYITPAHQLNLTPWNPGPALGLLFITRRGRTAAAALFVAIVAGDVLLRGTPGNLITTLFLGATLTVGYTLIALAIKRRFPEGGMFSDLPGLLSWSAIVIFGSLANGLLFVTMLLATGLLPTQAWSNAVIQFWIGDGVAIFVVMPLLCWMQDGQRRLLFRLAVFKWDTLAYAALTLLALWIAFVPGAESHFRYFYLLFLPVVWAASRQGLPGAVLCVSSLQLGMLLAGLLQEPGEISLFELQMRALLLALVGFLIGVAVDEQRRAAADLRQSLRLAAAGEMAGALAHELNQPLTALSAYGSACEKLIEQGAGEAQVRDVIRRMNGEAARAAEVLRRLRDFFRTGATKLEAVSLRELVETVVAPVRNKTVAAGIALEIGNVPDASIVGDRLQLEVVLRNILSNAVEAIAGADDGRGRVALAAAVEHGGRVVVEVTDSGPGLTAKLVNEIFEPFESSKSSGLGLGLAISRAIAEAHGGSLTAVVTGSGGCFRLTLPIETRKRNTHG